MPDLLSHPRLKPIRKFLSTSFHEPLGSQIEPDEVRGYYIDMRVKARRTDWPAAWPWPPGSELWVAPLQMALGAHERWLAGEGEEWLGLARSLGEFVLASQVHDGPRDGALEHAFDFPHTFPLRAGWISAMAQGEAASLFVRLHRADGSERWAEAALRALRPMSIRTRDGGAMELLDGRPFPEEYPTDPPSFVLNGGMFAIWGWYDVGRALGDADAARRFEEAVDTLAQNIERWDTGWWSRYDLYPHRVANVASLAYHELHLNQLRAMTLLAPRPQLAAAAARFEHYLESRARRAGAFAAKAAFRVAVPRRKR